MRNLIQNTVGLGVLITLSTAAHAATITTLFNTGVDSSGNTVATDTPDAHYSLVAGAGAAQTGIPNVIAAGTFPADGTWAAAGLSSNWIGTTNTGGSAGVAPVNPTTGILNMYYETTFSMAGLDTATATITFDWNADNFIAGFYINNNLTTLTKSSGFDVVESVTLTATELAFLNAGNNTFKFHVQSTNAIDDPNTTDYYGLNVDFTTRTANAIPEPSALGLLGLGSIAALGLRRRRA